MLKEESSNTTNFLYTMQVGAVSGAINFSARLPFEAFAVRQRDYPGVIVTRSLRESFYNFRNAISPNHQYQGIRHLTRSLFNVGFGWSLGYRLAEGALTFPLQKKLKNGCITQFDHPHNPKTLILINALAGWASSMTELLCLHTTDSMKIKTQTYQPCFISGSSIRYFIHHQKQLRNGIMLNAIRISLVSPMAWGIKGATEIALQKTEYDQFSRTILSACAFILAINAISNPFEMIRIQLLKEVQPHSRYEKAKQVCHVTQRVFKQHGVHAFWRGLGMTATASFLTRLPQICLFDMMTK